MGRRVGFARFVINRTCSNKQKSSHRLPLTPSTAIGGFDPYPTASIGLATDSAGKLNVFMPRHAGFSRASATNAAVGTAFMFFLRQGERRWETRRDAHNWQKPMMWRGFCWRGVDRPASRATQVKIQIALLCKAGQLLEAGECDAALAQGVVRRLLVGRIALARPADRAVERIVREALHFGFDEELCEMRRQPGQFAVGR